MNAPPTKPNKCSGGSDDQSELPSIRARSRLFREVSVFGWSAPRTRSRVDEGPLEQRDRLAQSARRLVGAGEVVAGGEGVRVVGAQHPVRSARVRSNSGIAWPSPGRS